MFELLSVISTGKPEEMFAKTRAAIRRQPEVVMGIIETDPEHRIGFAGCPVSAQPDFQEPVQHCMTREYAYSRKQARALKLSAGSILPSSKSLTR